MAGTQLLLKAYVHIGDCYMNRPLPVIWIQGIYLEENYLISTKIQTAKQRSLSECSCIPQYHEVSSSFISHSVCSSATHLSSFILCVCASVFRYTCHRTESLFRLYPLPLPFLLQSIAKHPWSQGTLPRPPPTFNSCAQWLYLQDPHILFGHGKEEVGNLNGLIQAEWTKSLEDPNLDFLRYLGFFREEKLVPTSANSLRQLLTDETFVSPDWFRRGVMIFLGDGLVFAEGARHRVCDCLKNCRMVLGQSKIADRLQVFAKTPGASFHSGPNSSFHPVVLEQEQGANLSYPESDPDKWQARA